MNFDWSLPYPSQREAVVARNVVATSQPLAAQAGLDVLREGGNAIDAAIAVAATLTVVEPTSNGIGSDAFALVWAEGKLHGLNASGRSPRALTAAHFAGADSIPFTGWGGVTVPGAVSAWVALSQRFGSMPLPRLLAPAIEYARRGFHVSRQTAGAWAGAVKRYAAMPSFQETFAPGGRAPACGQLFRSEGHARTLERIAETNGDAFYHGDLAQRIIAHAEATDGLMTHDDLAEHQADWVDPIATEYHGHTLHEIPPNGQGLVALIMLGILRHHDLRAYAVDSADSLHLQIEAMKLAFVDGVRHVADATPAQAIDELLDEDYLAERASLIDMNEARDPGYVEPKYGGTVYLTVGDDRGNMVSYIQSNYTGFGSGIVIPEVGIAMQNRGCCFSLEPGHPNQVAGGKRPYHTIIPGFVTAGGRPLMSFGVMGGYMQPQGHAQVLIRLADYGQNPQAALDAPRWQVFTGKKVGIESGLPEATCDELRRRGHELEIVQEKTVRFGGGQAAYRLEDGYLAASDLRRDGQAVGF